MLMWWERDGLTKLAVLYIESVRQPAQVRPDGPPGQRHHARAHRAGRPRRAQSEAPSREALFEQAGVITTRGFGELIQATALLATQPAPAGRTVAIVSNVGSAGMLAADACTDRGLSVHHPSGLTRRRLRTVIPGGTVTGPVDTTGTVSAEDFRQCLELLAAEEDVHAIVAIVLPTGATGALEAAIQAAASSDVMSGVPLVAVVLTQPESVRLPGPDPGLRLTGGRGAGAGPCGRLRRLAGRTARSRARLRRRQDRGRPHAGPRVRPAGPGLAPPRTSG